MDAIINILQQLQTRLRKMPPFKREICYRGVANKTWKEEPAIFRKDNLQYETKALNEIIRQFPEDFRYSHTIDVLTQLQHYACPTRMLDVTSNFLVSLFFACGGLEQALHPKDFEVSKSIDGKISIYHVPSDYVKSIDSETAIVISNIARIEGEVDFKKYAWKCVKDQQGAWDVDNEELIRMNLDDLNKVVLVKTKLNNPRVRAQFGEFFLFGGVEGLNNKSCLTSIMNCKIHKKAISFPKEYIYDEILVPANDKEKILTDLKQYFGICFATLCPEKHDVIQTLIR